MKQSINFYDFEQAFKAYNRFDNFGYDGLKVLFEYLEDYEDSTGEELELDVIALCCDFNMLSIDDIYSEYIYSESCGNKHVYDKDAYEDLAHMAASEQDDYILEWLSDQTIVVGTVDNGEETQVIFQVF